MRGLIIKKRTGPHKDWRTFHNRRPNAKFSRIALEDGQAASFVMAVVGKIRPFSPVYTQRGTHVLHATVATDIKTKTMLQRLKTKPRNGNETFMRKFTKIRNLDDDDRQRARAR